jgi:hypothetical protein
MAPAFSDGQITELHQGRLKATRAFDDLRQRYLMRRYKSSKASEYATHGFSRRLRTLIRAINLVFEFLPPELDARPDGNAVVDATIAIQCFVLNTFGCLDNLAWIWVCEKGLTMRDGAALDPQSVSLGNRVVRASFSNDFSLYLDSREKWFMAIKEFRDALVHCIPLYIPRLACSRFGRHRV